MRKRPPNLQDLIRGKAYKAPIPSNTDIQHMLVSLLYDVNEDAPGHAHCAKVKLDILKTISSMNEKETPTEENDDLELLAQLSARAKSRLQVAAKQERTDKEKQDGRETTNT